VPPTLGFPADPALARARSDVVTKHPHLYRRQAVSWWRRRIPKHLRPLFSISGIRVSLGAHIVAEVATPAARLRVVTDLAFDEVERAVVTGLSLPD
jgi:hypothetical protein